MSKLRELAKKIPFAKRIARLLRPVSVSEQLDLRDDAQMAEILKRVLKVDSNTIDVGAHCGDMLAKIIPLAERGEHYAFEAIPSLSQHVQQRFPQVKVQCLAISDSEGSIEFNWFPTNPAYSGIKQRTDVRPTDLPEKIEARTAPLDTLIPGDLPIRLIKIDVEGAELAVLRGARKLLSKHQPYIFFEHGSASALYGTTSADVFRLLAEVGLSVWRMDRFLANEAPY
jgi:FkbM family methyltransferase